MNQRQEYGASHKRQLLRIGIPAALVAGCVIAVACGSDGDATARPVGHGGTDGGATEGGGTGGVAEASPEALIKFDQQSEQGEDCVGGCPENQVCSHGICVSKTSCQTAEDCDNDTYCVPGTGCVPWGSPPENKKSDPACVYIAAVGTFAPAVKCEFLKPPPGDAFPGHIDVQATPMVVNFHKPASEGPPSIVAPFTVDVPNSWTGGQGVIRVLRGSDCTLEANLGGIDLDSNGSVDWIKSSAPVAVGDLDLDGVAEIVAYGCEWAVNPGYGKCDVETTLAFTLKQGEWSLLWKARSSKGGAVFSSIFGGSWAGPSIHDLDDDGKPEVLREGYVFSSEGILLSDLPTGYETYLYGGTTSFGLNPTLANLDTDPGIELTNGAKVWEWAGGAWKLDTSYPGVNQASVGFTAVADFGAYGTGLPSNVPELAVVSAAGTLAIHALDGTLVLGPLPVPGGGGGNPTIADYDGDGLPEVGVAGQDYYSVFDIDCTASPRPKGSCAATNRCDDATGAPGPCPTGVLWSRKTQDHSSKITGSSVFDFEADGSAEAIYADECFARVYRGSDGEVLFSQYHSTCTWYENPVVADVDGNFRADLVVPSNLACSDGVNGISCAGSVDANGVDKQFAGLRCEGPADCVSGTCTAGFCRCKTTAECCSAQDNAKCLEYGFSCAAPPTSVGGDSTCRAAHPKGLAGIRVYSDANDKWVRSRTIWNQHAYAVTHVNEDGTIPKTSEWKKNWEQPELNNYRQNVPGTPNGQLTADLTAGASETFLCAGKQATLQVPICNRGADALGAGVTVGFYDGATKVCSTATTKALQPGECETVSCVWTDAPQSVAGKKNITVKTDDAGKFTECHEGNNEGTIFGVWCKGVS